MKLSASVLRRFVAGPPTVSELRHLLDDLGVEVKRVDDDVLTVELLANRGDHYCYEGVAREISGRTGAPVCLPEATRLDVGPTPWPLVLETNGCLVYSATLLVTDDPGRPLSGASALPLAAAGLNPVSAPVDATNLSNLELGQPTHAFDADTLVGPITIRDSRPGERAWPLFAAEGVELPAGTLVIADDEKILAIAGVIGCEESKTTESTRRLLLESATFDPIRVRKASRALGIHTDSSARFERGSDPARPLLGAGRVVHLLESEAGWRRQGTTGVVGSWRDPRRQIGLHIPSVASFIEHPLLEEEVRERLERYGFRVSAAGPTWSRDDGWEAPERLHDQPRERLRSTVLVQIPPHRLWDVETDADLIEELAKSIGYNNTPDRLPNIDLGALPTRDEAVRDRLEEVLLGNGFYEVVNDGFYGRDTRERLGLTEGHPLWDHVETLNALDRGYSLLRNNGLAQAVAAVATNLARKTPEVRAYEFLRTFHPDRTAANNVCTERRVVALIASGHDRDPSWARVHRRADALFLKGIVGELAVELRLPLAVVASTGSQPLSSCLHPHRQADIRLGDDIVGIVGEVHPAVVDAHRIKRARPVYAELDFDALLRTPLPRVYDEPSDLHPIARSLAFSLRAHVTAGEVAAVLKDQGPVWLRRVDIVDLFEPTDDDGPVRAVTFSLVCDGGRSAEEVNAACESLARAVERRFRAEGVVQR